MRLTDEKSGKDQSELSTLKPENKPMCPENEMVVDFALSLS